MKKTCSPLLHIIRRCPFSSPSTKTHCPEAKHRNPRLLQRSCSMVSPTRLHLNRAAPRRVCLNVCLMCDPCSSQAIPAAIPAEENGAAPGSDSAATDIHQRDLLHICFAKSDWTIRVCSDIFKVSQKLPEKPVSFLVLEVCYYKT